MQNKFFHVRALLRFLLPRQGQNPNLHSDLEELLGEADDDVPERSLSVPRLRSISLELGYHDFAWREAIHSCEVKFAIGDVGYLSKPIVDAGGNASWSLLDKERFNNFVKLGNLFETDLCPLKNFGGLNSRDGLDLNVVNESDGLQMQWVNGFMQRQDVSPFELPGSVQG